MLALVIPTLTMHPFRGGAPFPLPNRSTPDSWGAHDVVSIRHNMKLFAKSYPLPVSAPVSTIYPLGERSFSRLLSICLLHGASSIFLVSSDTFRSFLLAHFTVSQCVDSTLYLLCHTDICTPTSSWVRTAVPFLQTNHSDSQVVCPQNGTVVLKRVSRGE